MDDADLAFSGSLIKRGRGHLMSFLLVLAIICLIAVVINLIAGEDKLPRGLEGSTPWFGAGLAFFGALGAWVGWTSRIKIHVYRGAEVVIKVEDRKKPLLLEGPFTLKYGYTRIKMPRAPTMTCLLMGVYQADKCVLSLREEWGVIHGTPDGWPSELPQLDPAPFYDVMGRRLMNRLISVVES
jgi:hypothetical protein